MKTMTAFLATCLLAGAAHAQLGGDAAGNARAQESINRTDNEIARSDSNNGMSAGRSLINGNMSPRRRAAIEARQKAKQEAAAAAAKPQ